MLDTLGLKLTGLGALFNSEQKTLDEASVAEACQQLRRALLEADVSYRVARQFVKRVREKALNSTELEGWDAEDQFMGVMHQELVALLGEAQTPLNAVDENQKFTPENPAIILLCGLQGAGKTTTCAKLGHWLSRYHENPFEAEEAQSQPFKPYLIAADTVRPAAMEQLALMAEKAGLPCYVDASATEMKAVIHAGLAAAKNAGATHILVDTAGRIQMDTATMADLYLIRQQLNPTDTLLVIDAMIGQEAVNVIEAFNTQLQLSGCILSKMDGDAKGGAMLSIREATGLPIQFVGEGETIEDLAVFHPDRMAQRLMGMGDMATLFEKAMTQQQESSMASVSAKLMRGELNFEDYVTLQESIQKLGGLGAIMGMLPMMQMDAESKQALGKDQKKKLRQWRALLNSMTLKERRNPNFILETPSRRERIFTGSGIVVETGEAMLEEFSGMYQMAQGFKAFGSFFGGGDDDTENGEDTAPALLESSSQAQEEDPDDPMGWGEFFNSMGGLFEEEEETKPQKLEKKAKGKKPPSPFPW